MRRRTRIGPRLIPADFYRKIVQVMPISCVDVIVSSRGKFLLCKRKNKPAQGKWWFIGGRVFKNETLQDAVRRKVLEETGMSKMKIKKLLAAKETIFKDSAFGPSTHSVNSVFLVETNSKNLLRPDSQSSELHWFSRIDGHWQSYVKDVLRLAGF
jgi:colanic acid biosynthesis protein WcaH